MTAKGEEVLVEQRRLRRARVQLPARYLSSNLSLEGHVTDLSPEGLFFTSEYLDDAGEKAHVWVEVPSRSSPLKLRCEVRWVKDSAYGCGMGIQIVDVPPGDRLLLASLGAGGGLSGPIMGTA